MSCIAPPKRVRVTLTLAYDDLYIRAYYRSGAVYYTVMIPILFGFITSDLFGVYGAERAINTIAPGLCRLAFAIVWLPIVHITYEFCLLVMPLRFCSRRSIKTAADADSKV